MSVEFTEVYIFVGNSLFLRILWSHLMHEIALLCHYRERDKVQIGIVLLRVEAVVDTFRQISKFVLEKAIRKTLVCFRFVLFVSC